MRAGLLKEILVFESPTKQETDSGFVRSGYAEIFRCRARRVKQHAVLDDEESAREVFMGQTAVFQTRKYPQITYDCRVRWGGALWLIKMIEPESNELTLTLRKIDE